jgi:hypothetical protein
MVQAVDVARSQVARTPRRHLALVLAGIAVMIARAPAARAETERVVLAGLPDNLADATGTVLLPWHIELVRVAEAPASDEAQARREVATLAARARAGAVVWLAPPARPPTLWLYDVSSQRLLSRPLSSAPPYDDPTAASVALSIKTLLRHSSVAPPAERVAPPPAPPRAGLRPYTAGAQAALRLSRDQAGDWHPEPRLGVGITWWPAFVPGRHGLGVQVELGPGQRVQKSGFRGRLLDASAILTLRRDVTLPWQSGRLSVVPMLGAGVHVTRLSGEQQPMGQPVYTSRLVPAVAAGVDVYARIGRLMRIGVALHGARMLRTGDYESMERSVASAPVLLLSAGVALLVSL